MLILEEKRQRASNRAELYFDFFPMVHTTPVKSALSTSFPNCDNIGEICKRIESAVSVLPSKPKHFLADRDLILKCGQDVVKIMNDLGCLTDMQ